MDPTQCYQEMIDAILEGDRVTAVEYARNLKAWIDKGGMYPQGRLAEVVDAMIAMVTGMWRDEV